MKILFNITFAQNQILKYIRNSRKSLSFLFLAFSFYMPVYSTQNINYSEVRELYTEYTNIPDEVMASIYVPHLLPQEIIFPDLLDTYHLVAYGLFCDRKTKPIKIDIYENRKECIHPDNKTLIKILDSVKKDLEIRKSAENSQIQTPTQPRLAPKALDIKNIPKKKHKTSQKDSQKIPTLMPRTQFSNGKTNNESRKTAVNEKANKGAGQKSLAKSDNIPEGSRLLIYRKINSK
ncbi:hypothetical protein [Candidatus Nesciobacter abundans]|uniref:Uncharacterized protein n=1 Tax=Candidatus Nesciobacter abundans TaxID=2601668 RepID=A0A5C0UGZ0_9PROT|nr:hypothetical protein [Candidatus Nesciobacter abundans]QEK38931.1 hypothetical protein FZC36_00565 [Candidatus Nesciobacter abundans]